MTDGTGQEAELDWVRLGGKTGTTEKLVNGGYSRERHYASFVGIAPLEEPRLVCFIVIDEPQGRISSFGGSAAAPVFREILEASGRLPGAWLGPEYETLVVTRDPARRPEPGTALAAGGGEFQRSPSPEGVPDVRGESLRRALMLLRAYGVAAEVTGSGTVVRQEPEPGGRKEEGVRLYCSREGAGAVVPAGTVLAREETKGNVPGS
jgi:hypothetical protein